MTRRAAARIGYGVVVLACLVGTATMVIRFREADVLRRREILSDGMELTVSGDAVGFGLVLIAVLVGLLGTLIVSRLPRNVVGWIFVTTGFVMPIGGFSEVYYGWSELGDRALPGAGLAWDFYNSGGAFFWAPLFALLLLFPDGRLPPGRWRWLVPITGTVLALFVLEPLLHLGLIDVLWAAQLLLVLLGAGALVARFRRAGGVERQQLRWIASSGVLVAIGAITLFATGAATDGVGDAWWMAIGPAFLVVGFVSMPVAATVAITRYRLYELDRLVTRATTYAAVVVAVAAIYVATVLSVGAVVPGARDSDLAVAMSTLLAAAAFSPLQRRIRLVIDRRFHRQRYDAVVALERLGARLRDEVDEQVLVDSVTSTLSGTLRPSHVSVWLAR